MVPAEADTCLGSFFLRHGRHFGCVTATLHLRNWKSDEKVFSLRFSRLVNLHIARSSRGIIQAETHILMPINLDGELGHQHHQF